jgi:hypothetical protein
MAGKKKKEPAGDRAGGQTKAPKGKREPPVSRVQRARAAGRGGRGRASRAR